MLPSYFVFLTLPVSIYYTLKYIQDTLSNKIQPNIVSWAVWATASLLSFFVALSTGIPFLELFSTFISGLVPLIIVLVLIFVNKGKFIFSKLDIFCFGLAILGLILWKILGPIYGYGFGLLADMTGFVPTLVKTFKNPKSETIPVYVMGMISSVINILTLQNFSLFTLGFPIYITSFNSLIVIMVLWDKYRVEKV